MSLKTRLARWRRPILIGFAAVVVDFGIRLAVGFDMARIVPAEAVLFAVGGLAFAWAARAERADPPARRLDWWLAGLFVLAAVRSAIWAAGQPVWIANVVILVIALPVAFRLVRLRRRRRRADGDTEREDQGGVGTQP